MINKYSSPSTFSDQIADEMKKSLQDADQQKFSLAELSALLVKCAEHLETTDDALVAEVDHVLNFIEVDLIK